MAKFLVLSLAVLATLIQVDAIPNPNLQSVLAKVRSRYPKVGSYANSAAFAGRGTAGAQSSAGYQGPNSGEPIDNVAAAAHAAAGLDAESPADPSEPLEPIGLIPESEPGVAPPPPVKPVVNLDQFKMNNFAFQNFPSQLKPKPVAKPNANAYASAAASVSSGQAGANAAARSSAGAAATQSSAGAAATVSQEEAHGPEVPEEETQEEGEASETEESESYEQPEEVAESSAVAGTYNDDGALVENSLYQRETEDQEDHEDGKADEDHYYKAQSYGKAQDERKRERYNKNFEDIEHSPTIYRSKKNSENYELNYDKASRLTGSGVFAKDRRSSAFQRNRRRFNERVNQTKTRTGAGVDERAVASTNNEFDDEEEEIMDSAGLATPKAGPVQVNAEGSAATASARASASVRRN